jgi:YD repeat-containing protein
VENYQLVSKTHKDYDQVTPANYSQSVINYTYCANKRTVQTTSSTDSKGQTVTKTVYHADDASIPMVTSPEQTAITALLAANFSNAVVHETTSKNGAVSEQHNTFTANLGGTNNKIFLTSSSSYKGGVLANQQFFNYDNNTAQAVASNTTAGKYTSFLYGYNSALPIAKVVNANISYTSSPSSATGVVSGTSANFVVDYTGTITFTLSFAGSPGGGTAASSQYSLSGPANRSGILCLSAGGNCSGNPYFISFTNMPPGNYYLSVYPISSPFPTGFSYTYPKYSQLLTPESYYMGFEDLPYGSTIIGSGHTGRVYYNATVVPYQVNFALPNARSYVIQWWNWVNGKWAMNEDVYTGPRSISGIIDDIRIFPSDAQMTNLSYDPLIGKTGEIDVSGKTMTYEYDGLNRLNIVRDNDRNIVSKKCYTYSGQAISCPATVWTNSAQSGIYARNDCGVNYVGTPVTYNVAAGVYSSSVSPQDADQQALNDIYTNGQAYANNPANGSTCVQVFPVTYNNQTAVNWSFSATNNSTSVVYNSTANASTNGTMSISLPAGTYTFVFSCGGQTMPNPPTFTVNGVVQAYSGYTNVTATFFNVSVSSGSTNPLITIVLQTPVSCSFTAASTWSIPTSSISSSGGLVSFYIVLYTTSSKTWTNANVVATINGGCVPSATRSFAKTDGSGRLWEMVISTSGQLSIRLLSGSPPGVGSTISFTGCGYSL